MDKLRDAYWADKGHFIRQAICLVIIIAGIVVNAL